MKTIKIILGSLLVYLCVAMLHACGGTSPMMASGSGGSAGASAAGSGGHGGKGVAGTTGTSTVTNPVPDANADDQSGSRIEILYLIGDDGSKFGPTAYDTKLKMTCGFYAAADGRVRCLPGGTIAATGGAYFSDVGCTTTVGQYASCYGMPSYITVYSPAPACTAATTVYTAGAEVTGSIYAGSPASCQMIPTADLPSGYVYYSLGMVVPPSTFVGFTPQSP